MRSSDLVVAVASLLFATDPTLATLLAATPGSTLDSDVQVLDWAITMDSGHVTAEIVLARERTTTGRVRARVRLSPVGVMGLLMGLEIKGSGEGYKRTY